MKIVEIQPRISYYIGGGEIVPTYQMLALSELGEDVYLITTTPKHQTEYLAMLKKKINVIELPIKALDFFKDKNEISFEDWNIESLKLQIIAAKKIKELNADIVVSHYPLDHILVSSENMVLHLHGYIENRFEYETNGFKLAKKIVAVSKTVKEKWSNLYPEYSNKIKVIYNGVPVNHFKPQNVEKKYDLIYVGRLIKIKGLDYLIKAIKGLNLKVLIVGDGPERNKLQNLAERLNVNVKFLRYAKYEELPYIYSSSKIALFPSYSREGVLTSMLEAMACGVGIVTTDAGSMKEALERGGIIVRAKDVNSLRKGIKEALENYEELGKAARKNVIANFELRKRTRELLKFYKKLR